MKVVPFGFASLAGLSVLILALAFPTSPARACSFAPTHDWRVGLIKGDACSAYRKRYPGEYVGLTEAEDLGGGFFWQLASDGNACEAERHSVVVDCSAGEAVVLGPYQHSVQGIENSNGTWVYALDDLKSSVRQLSARGRLSLAAASEQGSALKLSEAVHIGFPNQMKLNGQSLNLQCGCKLYYPDLGKGTN
jgi:hypothetical protein